MAGDSEDCHSGSLKSPWQLCGCGQGTYRPPRPACDASRHVLGLRPVVLGMHSNRHVRSRRKTSGLSVPVASSHPPTAPRGGVHIHICRCVTPGMRDGRRGPSFTRIRLAPKNGQRAKDAAKEARRTHNAGERDGGHTGRSWVCVGQRGLQMRTGTWQMLGLDVPTDTGIQTPAWLFPVLVVL